MPLNTAFIIGGVFALIATIVLYVMVMGKKKDGKLSPFLQFLHDLFNFKYLVIEHVLKFFYVLSTCACILIGFFMLFSVQDGYFAKISYAVPGLIIMIAGPVLIRIMYELTMLAVLLVKNVIELNNKIKGDGGRAFGDVPSMPQIHDQNNNNDNNNTQQE